MIGSDETVRVRYKQNQPQVEAERRLTTRQARPVKGQASTGQTRVSKQARRVSAAKKVERERRQRATRIKRTVQYLAGVLAVAALVWGCIVLYQAPILPVRDVEVTGLKRLDRQQILGLARLADDETLLRLPVEEIENRIASSPWVFEARVYRQLPGTVRIEVVERTPVAIVDAGGTNLWLIGSDGHWLGERTARDEGLVVIRDVENLKPSAGARAASPELLNALRVVAGISPELLAVTQVVSAPTVDKTALMTEEDVEVFIGAAEDLVAKDRIVREILDTKADEVVYINVRVVESPIWRGLEDSR